MDERRIHGSDLHAGAREPNAAQGASDRFREGFARWASGVAIVAGREDDGHVLATTVSSLASVSADPPTVVIGLGANARVLPVAAVGAALGISVLGEDQRKWASIFADSFPVSAPAWSEGAAPLIPDAVVGLRCTVDAVHPTDGASRLVLCRVEAVELGDRDRPLLHWMRSYRRLGDD